MMKKLLSLLLACVLALGLFIPACTAQEETDWDAITYYYSLLCEENREDLEALVPEDGWYYDVINVGIYLYCYGELPENYITKNEARKLGWTGGNVARYQKGAAIGGDYFGNYEGVLPEAKGIKYTECDIDTDGEKSRGARRMIFDNEGRIYYTEDHYETFTLLYEPGMNGEEK